MTTAPTHELAEWLVAELQRQNARVALAESLTGGLLTSSLVDVPGASLAVLGGVVAYATPLKAELLGVDRELLAERGAIDPDVARQMARGVRERLAVDGRAAEYGLATTGAAGPDPQDGHPAGTVWIALATTDGTWARGLLIAGDRAAVREATVDAALGLLEDALTGNLGDPE